LIQPSLASARSSRAIRRNLALDVVAAIGMGVTMALVGAILPTVARRGGLPPIGLSALAAAPFIANLLGAFAGRIGARRTGHLTLIRGIGAASLVLLAVAPPPPVVVAVAIVFWLSISFGGPFHLRLWGAMYPARLRGRVLGVLGMSRAAAGALAAIGGGVLADRIGGEQAVAIAGAVGAACALAYLGIRAARSGDGPPTFSARQAVTALRERPLLSRIAVAQGFYGGGLIAATPLYALVNVDRLDLSLADVGVIGILTAVATTVAFPIWGLVADRFGPVVALRTGSAIGLTALFAYAIAPNVLVLWVGALAAGTGSASIDVGIAAAVSDQTPLPSRAAAMAGWNALTGARGVMAAFLMSVLLELGLVDVTFALLACGATSAVGVALFFRAGRAWTDAPAAAPSPMRPLEGSNLPSLGGRAVPSSAMSAAVERP
jgi:MFS transporter, DHA1 family, staphyloferrin B biosynthesis exporter